MAVAPLRYAGSPAGAGDRDIARRTTAAPGPRSPSSTTKRLTLVATILGSSIAILDASVAASRCPRFSAASAEGLRAKWVTNAYLLTLGSFILLEGSLGDIFGERRVFALGVAGFGVRSLLCAIAPGDGLEDQPQTGDHERHVLIGAVGIRDPRRAVDAKRCPGGQLTGAPLDAAGLHAPAPA